jgi:phosphoadenosine phosphosulfate reductase
MSRRALYPRFVMHVTMIKKKLLSGEPCKKCAEAEDLLRARGLWDRIDRVVWAIEGEPSSEGMQLAASLGVENAPFFVVRDGSGTAREEVVESTLKLMRFLTGSIVPTSLPPVDRDEVARMAEPLTNATPQDSLRFLLSRFGEDCAISFSGAEDVVLIDMASRTGLRYSVFSLDTGRLHAETYRFIDKVRAHYGIDIALFSPQAEPLQAFVKKKGLFSFYQDGHGECCGVRKIEPLKRALSTYRAWITGQRRDQSPTRADVPVLQADNFPGKPGSGVLIKCNPLAAWSSAQVWTYIQEHNVPYNELHERGFKSIGCEPCTRPVLPNQHERAGRWWWEDATKRECGLHVVTPHGDGI